MNETTSTMTATAPHLLGTVPTGEWFTMLCEATQADVTKMVNEQGYPLSDIRDFIEQYGEEAYASGHYVTWCELEEQIGAPTEAIEVPEDLDPEYIEDYDYVMDIVKDAILDALYVSPSIW